MTRLSNSVTKQALLTDTVLRIVAERGLDEVSVREVAAGAEVSIGTVQHYFPTKDSMLAAAYTEILSRIRDRLAHVRLGPDVRQNLAAVLSELLPLDPLRIAETRVHLAFAARAATTPELAATQRLALAELHRAITDAFANVWGDATSRATCRLAAHAAVAAADGLALHAVSSAGWLSRPQQAAALRLTVDALVALAPPG